MNATLSSCRLMSSDASVKQAAESKAIEVKPKRALLEANILSESTSQQLLLLNRELQDLSTGSSTLTLR
ncbi:hypothetical protein BASA60_010312 [Batrachochytrium salamandrivorans]|nr:hypothetical protein BASA60_010312 [Batrachochytrium salamandrivorans]